MEPRKASWVSPVLVAVAMLAWIAHFAGTTAPLFPVDDAYITLHNARALLSGVDKNFGGTPALVGATSSVHLAAVAALGVAMPLPWALDASLWIAAVLYALGIARLATVLGASPVAACLLALAGLLAGGTPHQLFNGLETGLAMAACVWALALASERAPSRAVMLVLGALCGAMPFIRPELAALSLLLLPVPAIRLYRIQGSAAALRALVLCSVAAVLCALPWIIWTWAVTGSVIPATAGAKRAWFAEAGLPAVVKSEWVLNELSAALWSFGLVSLAAMALVWRTLTGVLGLLFAAALVAVYWVNLPGALAHYERRYLFVLAPVLLLGAATAFRYLRPRRQALFAAALLAQGVMFAPAHGRQHQEDMDFTSLQLQPVAAWCTENLPRDAVLLVHDVGYIAWATSFRMVDLVGLKTPGSIPDHQAMTFPSNGQRRHEAIARIASRAGATHLVSLDSWDSIFLIQDALREHGWKLDPLRTTGRYRVFAITAPKTLAPSGLASR
jgi:hypothetical protein